MRSILVALLAVGTSSSAACVLDVEGQQGTTSGGGGGGGTTTTTSSTSSQSSSSSSGGGGGAGGMGGAGGGGAGGMGGAGGGGCVGDDRALGFDGVDDRMAVPLANGKLEKANDFFVGAYVEPSFDAASIAPETLTVFELRSRGQQRGYSLVLSRTSTDPVMSPRLEVQLNDGGNAVCVGKGLPVLTGQRVHVAASFEKPNIHVYVDGVQTTTVCAVNQDLRPITGDKSGAIGWSADLGGAFFKGKLDDVLYRDVKVTQGFTPPPPTANCKLHFGFGVADFLPDEGSSVLGLCDGIDGVLGLGSGVDAADPMVLCGP